MNIMQIIIAKIDVPETLFFHDFVPTNDSDIALTMNSLESGYESKNFDILCFGISLLL